MRRQIPFLWYIGRAAMEKVCIKLKPVSEDLELRENKAAPICWVTLPLPVTTGAQTRSWELNPGFPHGCQEPNQLNHHHCFPGFALAGRWSQESERVLSLGIPKWGMCVLTRIPTTMLNIPSWLFFSKQGHLFWKCFFSSTAVALSKLTCNNDTFHEAHSSAFQHMHSVNWFHQGTIMALLYSENATLCSLTLCPSTYLRDSTPTEGAAIHTLTWISSPYSLLLYFTRKEPVEQPRPWRKEGPGRGVLALESGKRKRSKKAKLMILKEKLSFLRPSAYTLTSTLWWLLLFLNIQMKCPHGAHGTSAIVPRHMALLDALTSLQHLALKTQKNLHIQSSYSFFHSSIQQM